MLPDGRVHDSNLIWKEETRYDSFTASLSWRQRDACGRRDGWRPRPTRQQRYTPGAYANLSLDVTSH